MHDLNTPQRSPNKSPSPNNRNNNNFDVAFAHLSQNAHDTLLHDTENRSATYNNDDNDKDPAASRNSDTSCNGSYNTEDSDKCI